MTAHVPQVLDLSPKRHFDLLFVCGDCATLPSRRQMRGMGKFAPPSPERMADLSLSSRRISASTSGISKRGAQLTTWQALHTETDLRLCDRAQVRSTLIATITIRMYSLPSQRHACMCASETQTLLRMHACTEDGSRTDNPLVPHACTNSEPRQTDARPDRFPEARRWRRLHFPDWPIGAPNFHIGKDLADQTAAIDPRPLQSTLHGQAQTDIDSIT
jgi:hypothetical protein